MNKIVVVEDDIYLREELIHTFEKKGYPVTGISSFTAPEPEILDSRPDLVVLDINLPGKSGFELCQWLKAHTCVPVLILTARDTLSDELYALGLGADDFLTKPCHPDRLLARADRLLNTYGKLSQLVQAGPLSMDTDTFKLVYKEKYMILPETEGKLLLALMEQYPLVVTKEALFKAVWGGSDYVDENILQVNMTRLRKSLDGMDIKDLVKTVRGRGYCLEVDGL